MEELHRNEGGRQSRERAAQAVLSDESAECTFSPALNPRSLKVAGWELRTMPAPLFGRPSQLWAALSACLLRLHAGWEFWGSV